jgi:hypothetical protein
VVDRPFAGSCSTMSALSGIDDGSAALVGKVGDRLAGITIASAAVEVVEVSI